jgi:cytochrome c oxidase subunit 1
MDNVHQLTHGEVAHDVHHDHGHEHHELNFIEKYIFSQDHKTIAKQFLILGMVWAVVGGLFSVLFRLQLAWPNESFPILETLLGRWAEGGKLLPEGYYALVTMHGTIIVFFVLTAGLSGTFSNFLIPLQIGARDMAAPFMNMLSFWFFVLSSLVMTISLFVQTGPAAGGWTIYPPLSALPQASSGSGVGMDLWLLSIGLFIVSVALGGLNYVSTVINMRTKGMTFFRMPLTVWAFFFTAVIALLSFPVLLAAAIMLLFDRNLGTSFFLSDIYIGGKHLLYSGGSPI